MEDNLLLKFKDFCNKELFKLPANSSPGRRLMVNVQKRCSMLTIGACPCLHVSFLMGLFSLPLPGPASCLLFTEATGISLRQTQTLPWLSPPLALSENQSPGRSPPRPSGHKSCCFLNSCPPTCPGFLLPRQASLPQHTNRESTVPP